MAGTDNESDSTHQRSKRQKISAACKECRIKKIRCDGERPVCGPCLKKFGAEAKCELRLTAAQELAALHAQVANLGGQVGEIQARGSQPDAIASTDEAKSRWHRQDPPQQSERPVTISRIDPRYAKRAREAHPDAPTYPSPRAQMSTRRSPDLDAEQHVEEVDGMVGSTSCGGADDEPYFGSSSAGGFVRQVRRAIDGPGESTRMSQSADTQAYFVKPKSTPRGIGSTTSIDGGTRYSSVTDNLLQLYWRIVHPLYPFLAREETQEAYQSLRNGTPLQDHLKAIVCQLDVIFALSCQLDERLEPPQRLALSEEYIATAKQVLNADLWEQASLTSVQNFLLLSQYLQSTNRPYQCWMAVGQAIRMAQNLGLHLSATTQRIVSPRKQQLWRKVWYGCILMDRIVAMTYGRPVMISVEAASSVPMPVALDDEFIATDPRLGTFRRERGPMLIDFFLQTSLLYEVMGKILTWFYSREDSDQSAAEASGSSANFPTIASTSSLLELDQALSQWSENLPEHLSIVANSQEAEVFRRQANILHSRFLHVRILLHRPALASVAAEESIQPANSDANTTLMSILCERSSSLCVEAAIASIEQIQNRLPADVKEVGSLPAWWYNVLYIYTAATVLLAAMRSPKLASNFGENLLMDSLRNGMSLLQRYRIFSSSVRKSITVLEVLLQHMTSRDTGALAQTREAFTFTQPHKSGARTRGNLLGQEPRFPEPSSHQYAGLAIPMTPTVHRNDDIVSVYASGQQQHLENTGSDVFLQTIGSEDWGFEEFDINFDPGDLSWLNTLPHNL